MFNKEKVLKNMEGMRFPNGAFIASPGPLYTSMWIRDTLYASFAYYYLGEYQKLKEGLWVVFDLFRKYGENLETRIASPADVPGKIIHAKYHPETLEEVTTDEQWSHHQLDALGLFLYIVADLDFKNVSVVRGKEDLEIIQLLIWYLRSVEYWVRPDSGIWEEYRIRHSSSIGSVIAGLSHIRKQHLAIVPDPLIRAGEEALRTILPLESPDLCDKPHHSHDCDAAQLTLIWPYHIVNKREAEEILRRIVEGHKTGTGESHRLLQKHGCNRYWGDDYYRSLEEGPYQGISAEWPMFKFWISIIYSQFHDEKNALYWFKEGCQEIVDDLIPEAYTNGKPNDHTPLAWAHAIALIAFSKLSPKLQSEVNTQKSR